MKRPSNRHGYSSSRPFLSPMDLGLVFVVAAKDGSSSVGHLNACRDVDNDEEADAGCCSNDAIFLGVTDGDSVVGGS